ncbi:hypothetical protein [Scytonema sp. UIC 10036]|uniref:hypothetical protein n=1 Tax=Scytonema sp. UIC 10036 TaxID=2304196 RepID=UPI001FAAE7E0|nr:hypothetical protein [Scytonema sp. UIC 10036]
MTNSSIKRILILAANPTNTTRLRLDEEVREIETAIKQAQKRDQFDLVHAGLSLREHYSGQYWK